MDHEYRLSLAIQLAAPHIDFKAAGNMTQGTNIAASRIIQAYEAIQKAEQQLDARMAAAPAA